MGRSLYLIAYDVANPNRLTKVRRTLKEYSTGGQKSVFECHLYAWELKRISGELAALIDLNKDRVHIFAMDGRSRTHTLGIALQPADPAFFFIG